MPKHVDMQEVSGNSGVVRDASVRDNAPTSLYLYYDRFDVLLYVGITSRGMKRNFEHNADKEWWQYVARQEVKHLPSRAEAQRIERELIIGLRPPFNKQHNRDHEELAEAYRRFIAKPTRRNAILGRRDRIPKEPDWLDKTPLRLELTEKNGKFLHCRSRAEDVVLATSVNLEATPFDTFKAKDGKVGSVVSLTRAQFGFEMVLKGAWLRSAKEVVVLLGRVRASNVIQNLRVELEHHSLLMKPAGIVDFRKVNIGKFSNGVGWNPQTYLNQARFAQVDEPSAGGVTNDA